MFNFSICTVNVNGLRDFIKRRNVIQWLKLFRFDIVLLQETYLKSADFVYCKSIWDGPVFYSPAASNHSCGVAIACSRSLPCTYTQIRHDSNGRCISVLCTFQNTSFRLCNIYAPCIPKERIRFFNELYLYTRGNIPIILGGDFNCIMSSVDRSGDSSNTSSFVGRKELSLFIESFHLIDSWSLFFPAESGHTWRHAGKGLSSRLDRIYVSRDFVIEKSSILKFVFSDHDVVNTVIGFQSRSNIRNVNIGKGYWKCNISILHDLDFINELIAHYKLWSTLKPGFNSVIDWWDDIKGRIKKMIISHSVRIANQRRDRLVVLQNRCVVSNRAEIVKLLNIQGEGARIRARCRIIDEGEKPTSFFYKQERTRGDSKVIDSVYNREGRVVSDQGGIMDVFHSFYSDLFSESDTCGPDQDVFINSIDKCISPDDRILLESPIELLELKEALSTMAPNKSPGIDGLPCEFYTLFFDLVSEDLLAVYNDAFMKGCLSETQRTGLITLLPKKGDLLDPRNRRPISLLTIDYKILAKVLQIRLARVMPGIINQFQTCSVKGRSIHFNLSIIRDVVDYTYYNKCACALISIDQEKAFDKVNWDFLFRVLQKFNFGSNFCKWIKVLYSGISSRLLINGFCSDNVSINKGVRQGCPLSPSLYVLFIEPLAQYIAKSSIRGFCIPGSGGRVVKFLQYADDATCVASTLSDVKEFFNAFDLFRSATGATLNMNKTSGLKLGAFVGRKLPANIEWRDTCMRINGIMVGNSNAIASNWSLKMDKLKYRIGLWEKRFLTLLGKVLVINTLLYPVFYYLAPIFPVPGSVVREVDTCVFKFLWSNKTELVARGVVRLNRDEGGLGLNDFRTTMNALAIRFLFPLLRGEMELCYTIFIRYFTSCILRRAFVHVWSNSRPNSLVCTANLRNACDSIIQLLSKDNNFIGRYTSLTELVNFMRPTTIQPRVVRSSPSVCWVAIWRMVFHPILDTRLSSFNWRMTHNVLFTTAKLYRWGIGNGVCPMPQCTARESTRHMLWECSHLSFILQWCEWVYRRLDGTDFTSQFFLFGLPVSDIPNKNIGKAYLIFSIVKHMIWKRRCTYCFESVLKSEVDLLIQIKGEIRDRVLVDFKRWSGTKFRNVWVDGSTFVYVIDNQIRVML